MNNTSESPSLIRANSLVIRDGTFTQYINYAYQKIEHEFEEETRKLHALVSPDAFHDSHQHALDIEDHVVTPAEDEIIQRAINLASAPPSSPQQDPQAREGSGKVIHFDLSHYPRATGQRLSECIAKALEERRCLRGTFFFREPQQSDTRYSDQRIVSTLAYQLGVTLPATLPAIIGAIHSDLFIFERKLEKQMRNLVIEPLRLNASGDIPNMFMITDFPESWGSRAVQSISRAVNMSDGVHISLLIVKLGSGNDGNGNASQDESDGEAISATRPLNSAEGNVLEDHASVPLREVQGGV